MLDVLYLRLSAMLFYKCRSTFVLSRVCMYCLVGDVMAEVSVMCRTAHLIGDSGGGGV